MKLPQLLSLFLYQNKKLDLPGIGSFVLDPAAVIPEISDKNPQIPATGITFKNTVIHTADDALVQFIKEHTGKMKPLAAADLDFFLTTGKQLLNIGKVFYLEGIGTLVKVNSGKFEFTPGEYSTTRLEEPSQEKKERVEKKKPTFDEPDHEYEQRSHAPKTNNARQIVLVTLAIAVLVAIGWGGYHLYKRNTFIEPTPENTATVIADTPKTDTSRSAATPATSQRPDSGVSRKPDSLTANTPLPATGQHLYKWVILETDRKSRALRRYNQLLGFQLAVKMDQKDSSYFKLYFQFPAAIKDTAYIKDSLSSNYATRVHIEP
ncbi:hypothetical protein ACX0G9_02460 [Flavitalea flava]